jgi:drug/metabolite transporter (DMT)-like permease
MEKLKRLGFMQSLLAISVVIAFFGCIWLVMRQDVNANMRDALLILIGALAAAFGNIINYYFGSSKGSADKNELLAARDSQLPSP